MCFVLDVLMGVGKQDNIIGKVQVLKCCERSPSDASWDVWCCVPHDPVDGYDEERWWHYTTLANSSFDIKLDAWVSNFASEVDVETLDDVYKMLGDAVRKHLLFDIL